MTKKIYYSVTWVDPIDQIVEAYLNIKNKKSREARELKAKANQMINAEEQRVGRKLYNKL